MCCVKNAFPFISAEFHTFNYQFRWHWNSLKTFLPSVIDPICEVHSHMAINCIYSYKHNYSAVPCYSSAAHVNVDARLILMRTERWVKIIIKQTYCLNRSRLGSIKQALEGSTSFQFSLAYIIKLGAWLIHHYNISDLKQNKFDCRTVLLIEMPKGYNCGTGSLFFFFFCSMLHADYRNVLCYSLPDCILFAEGS